MITHLGDLTISFPMMIGILFWLWRERVSYAVWWLIAVVICVGLTTVAKVYLMGCPLPDLQVPSGHTSLSTLTYGGITLLLATHLPNPKRLLIIIAGVLLISAIGVSRIVVHAHNLTEVCVGLTIGLLSLVVFAQGYFRSQLLQAHSGRLRFASVGLVVIILVISGRGIHAEDHAHHIMLKLSQYFTNDCR